MKSFKNALTLLLLSTYVSLLGSAAEFGPFSQVLPLYNSIVSSPGTTGSEIKPCPEDESDNPPGGGVLWDIVKNHCVQSYRAGQGPGPCSSVSLESGTKNGTALLKALTGDTHFIVIPTKRVTGIEDPQLSQPNSPNYWQQAWSDHTILSQRAGRTVSREEIGLAINSKPIRSQNQLHIHLDCVDPKVLEALKQNRHIIKSSWGEELMFPGIGKHRVFFYPGDDLQNLDPFKLLAADLTGKNSTMAEHDLIVVAARSEEGKAGFYILDGYAASARSEDHIGGGEWALSSCKK